MKHLSLCALAGFLISWNAAADPLIVRTDSGSIRGAAMGEHAWAWLSIPYGKPPFGPLRWKAPEKLDPWDGILSCEQPAKRQRERGGVEDRLYLNVWRPQNDDRDLPVLVDIHGGGNMGYDGMANVMRTIAHHANLSLIHI